MEYFRNTNMFQHNMSNRFKNQRVLLSDKMHMKICNCAISMICMRIKLYIDVSNHPTLAILVLHVVLSLGFPDSLPLDDSPTFACTTTLHGERPPDGQNYTKLIKIQARQIQLVSSARASPCLPKAIADVRRTSESKLCSV